MRKRQIALLMLAGFLVLTAAGAGWACFPPWVWGPTPTHTPKSPGAASIPDDVQSGIEVSWLDLYPADNPMVSGTAYIPVEVQSGIEVNWIDLYLDNSFQTTVIAVPGTHELWDTHLTVAAGTNAQ